MDKGFLTTSVIERSHDSQSTAAHDDKLSKNCTCLSVINTNARSLCPKIDSLIDCMDETDASLAIVTETWLRDGDKLEQDIKDLSLEAGLGMLCKNRQPTASNGVCYGGVAIPWKETAGLFRRVEVHNPESHEVLVAAGSLRGQKRRLVVVACYMPPNLTKN